ncbi:MAG: hypothetical protein U9N08_00010 [Candidatus Caldatribacteriota bacterium]|nr:hypothetical protein [Candidatus Caldatribacteriota bacterium]
MSALFFGIYINEIAMYRGAVFAMTDEDFTPTLILPPQGGGDVWI